MKHALAVALASFFVAALPLAVAAQSSQGHPSAKHTMHIGSMKVISETSNMRWIDVARTSIRTPNKWELFIDVALQCGLFKDSFAANGAQDDANVQVRVLVDGLEAETGRVIFCRRTQELTGFPGLQACTNGNGERHFEGCAMSSAERQRALRSVIGNSFNYVKLNLRPGVHHIKVQVRLDPGTNNAGQPIRAVVGKGPTTVEQVRMINRMP